MTTYAPRYKTTLTEDEEAIARKAYGRKASPKLFTDRSIEGLIRANCGEKSEGGWRRFAKSLMV